MRPRLLLPLVTLALVAACGGAPASTPTAGATLTSPSSAVALPRGPNPTAVPAPSPTRAASVAMDPLVPAMTVDHPTVEIIPPDHLRHGQTVVVRVTGFGVGGKVWLSECASAADATSLGCGAELAGQVLLVTDEARSGRATFTVSATAAVGAMAAPAAEACADQCVIVATLGADHPFVVAPIAFRGE